MPDDTPISLMPLASALVGTEKVPAVQSGSNVHLTPSDLLTYMASRLGPSGVLTPPVNSQFSWINQGTAVITEESNGIYLSDTSGSGSGDSVHIRKKSVPAIPYKVTVALTTIGGTGSVYYGLTWRESSSGKLHSFLFGNSGTIYLIAFTNPTLFSSTTASVSFASQATQMPPRWMRLTDDNTNRICSYSNDGLHFFPIFSVARTNHLTADEWGFCINCKPTQASGLFIQSIVESAL